VALGLEILCPDVMTLNSAGGMIVVFALGSTPPFRNTLVQMAYSRHESYTMYFKQLTHQLFDTGDNPTGASSEIHEFLLDPRGY
jgi:hypothetical protein